MNSKSENIKTMISDEADKVIKELFDSLKNRYKKKTLNLSKVVQFFFYNCVMHKIQTTFTSNKIKRNSYNKTWGYTNTIPITTRDFLGLNTK